MIKIKKANFEVNPKNVHFKNRQKDVKITPTKEGVIFYGKTLFKRI